MSYRTYIAISRATYTAGIEAGTLRKSFARTRIIGEAFVADYLRVKLTIENNQRGYDLVDADG